MKEELVSAVNGFNNPTPQTISEAYEAFGGLRMISSILSLGNGGFYASATAVERAARETEITAESLQRRFGRLGIYFRLSVDQGDQNEHISLENQFGALRSHVDNYFAGDLVNASLDHYLQVSSHTSTINLESICRTKVTGAKTVGIPPLSAFFVSRQIPLDAITKRLNNRIGGSPALAVLIGMSGTGKTQLSLKYAYENVERYDHIIFLDASSVESVKKNLIARVRSIDRQLHPVTIQEVLDLLVNPEGNLTSNWLIIMDNADDTKVDLRDLIPLCDHGSILITSRSTSLSDLFPDGCVRLDVMSRDEAVDTLLLAAMDWDVGEENGREPGHHEVHNVEERRKCAGLIVDELGCLPLAVVQAACYIRRHKCMYDYPSRLKTSRDQILRWPASVQRDKLPYAHSTYAAFDTNVTSLSPQTLKLLGIISFFHFSGFPRQLIELAATLEFLHQPIELLERPSNFQESVNLLLDLFYVDRKWDTLSLDKLLEELQNCSLVTLIPVYNVVTLRFHPLLHGWANDRLSAAERTLYQAAAIRLLVCGTGEDHEYLRPHLYSHIARLPLTSDEIHVNDVAPLALTMASSGQVKDVVEACSKMYIRVRNARGDKDVKTVRASLELASAYQYQGDHDSAEQMRRDAVDILAAAFGEDHLETAYAMACLGRSCRRSMRYDEGKRLETEVLRIRREILGPRHRQIVEALQDLAATLSLQSSKGEAETLLQEAHDMIDILVGPGHIATIRVLEQLVDLYVKVHARSKSIPLQHKLANLWRNIHGDRHAKTLDATAALAVSYLNQGRFQEAERMWREVVAGRRQTLGPLHKDTLDAMKLLATTLHYHGLAAEATSIWEEYIEGLRESAGHQHETTLEALTILAQRMHWNKQYTKAGTLWEEVVQGRRQVLGATDKKTLEALHGAADAFYLGRSYIEAESYWKELWKGRRETFGADHRETLTALSWLALTVQIQKRHRDAESLRKAEVEGWDRLLGPGHRNTMDALSWLARAMYDQRRFGESEVLWGDLARRRVTFAGRVHESTLDTMSWLALTLCAQKKYKVAQIIWETILVVMEAYQGHSAAAILNTKSRLAQVLHGRGLYKKAELLWKEVVELREVSLGNEHKDTVYTSAWLERTQQAIAYEAQRQVSCYYGGNWRPYKRSIPHFALDPKDYTVSAMSTWSRQR